MGIFDGKEVATVLPEVGVNFRQIMLSVLMDLAIFRCGHLVLEWFLFQEVGFKPPCVDVPPRVPVSLSVLDHTR